MNVLENLQSDHSTPRPRPAYYPPQILWCVEASEAFDFYSEQWESYTGLSPLEIQGDGWASAIHPDDRAECFRRWEQAKQTGEPYEIEYRLRRADGVYRWHFSYAMPIRNGHGKILRSLGNTMDVDEKKRSEILRQFLIEADRILVSSLHYRETLQEIAKLAADAFCDTCWIDLQQSPENIERVAFSARFPKYYQTLSQAGFDQISSQAMLTGKPVWSSASTSAEIPWLRSYMVIPLQARGRTLGAVVFIASEQNGIQYQETDFRFACDLGRHIGLALDNGLLFEKADQAVQRRDEFLSIASHELKTPLTALLSQIQLLRLNCSDRKALSPEQVGALLERSESEIGRIHRLLNGLLDLSRISAGRFELHLGQSDLVRLAKSTIEALEVPLKRSGSSLSVTAPESILGTWDASRIEQVLTNLLSNAIKYGLGNPIDLRLRADADSVWIEIEDRGIGMAEENRDRIFNRFERLAPTHRFDGLGLGLYIVRKIVRSHGGVISVRSQLNEGSTFTVRLPRNSAPADI